VAKDDDFRLPSFGRGKDAVAVGVQKAEDLTESPLSRVIAKHPHLDTRGVTIAQARGELHFGMLGIVVPDEAANEPDNDHFVQGRGRHWKRSRLAARGTP
jgi:hypothetical protein